MNSFLFFIPVGYFFKTRLNTKQAILFHGYSEYLLCILLLIYSGIEPLKAIFNFVAAYFAFISIYEIGYIINDFISVKYENKPRKRLGDKNFSTAIVYAWIVVRIIAFCALTFYLGQFASIIWWAYYIVLLFTFFLHNMLKKKEFKIFTFISLAFLRFYAPLFVYIETSFLTSTMSGILLFYVFFRTLTYIDSKGLLMIPSRASFTFKINYYLILLPLSFIIALLTNNKICLWLNLYFLFFWGVFFMADKLGIISSSNIQTEPK